MAYLKSKVSDFLFFRSLPDDLIEKLIDCSTVQLLPASRTIYTADEVANHVYVVLSGSCMIFKENGPKNNKNTGIDSSREHSVPAIHDRLQVRYVTAGQTFGEAKFLSLEVLQPPSVVSLAEFTRAFQTRPITAPVLDRFGTF